MCVQQPVLLFLAPDTLRAKVDALCSLLRVSYPMGVCVASQAPSLLLKASSSLERKHALLQRLLALPAARVSALAVATPSVLTLGEEQLAGTWGQLAAATQAEARDVGLMVTACPGLMLLSPRDLEVGPGLADGVVGGGSEREGPGAGVGAACGAWGSWARGAGRKQQGGRSEGRRHIRRGRL
jgi:hypothetical protein